MLDNLANTRGDRVALLGLGAFTPIGPDAPSSAAAARAGIAGFAAHPAAKDSAGEPVIVARLADLDDIDGLQRFVQPASRAAAEALGPFLSRKTERSGTFYVGIGLPESRPGSIADLDQAVSATLAGLVNDLAPRRKVETFAKGHASGLLALKEAVSRIRLGKAELALVGGVDSYQDLETLAWLEATERLNGAGVEPNPWGFVPGEAAAFVLIGSYSVAEVLGIPVLGEVLEVGEAIEPNRIHTDDVCLGEGLTKAFREALGPLRDRPGHPKVGQVFCDMNGEPYRATEYVYAVSRHSMFFGDPGRFRAPADAWGDVGAASGPLGIILASEAGFRGYAEGEISVVWASSEGGSRAAALVQVPVKRKGIS